MEDGNRLLQALCLIIKVVPLLDQVQKFLSGRAFTTQILATAHFQSIKELAAAQLLSHPNAEEKKG